MSIKEYIKIMNGWRMPSPGMLRLVALILTTATPHNIQEDGILVSHCRENLTSCHEWVGGWTDGWMDGWTHGWMARWIDGWINNISLDRLHFTICSGGVRISVPMLRHSCSYQLQSTSSFFYLLPIYVHIY
jgi:hypothetical protein